MRPGPAALLLFLLFVACALWQFVLVDICFLPDLLDRPEGCQAASPLAAMSKPALVLLGLTALVTIVIVRASGEGSWLAVLGNAVTAIVLVHATWLAGREMMPTIEIAARELEIALRAEHKTGVGGVLGTNDYMITMRFMYLARRAGSRIIERDQRQLDNLYGYYEKVRGRQRRREVMGVDDRMGLITVFLKNANFVDTARLMENIRAYEQRVLAPVGARLEFAGDVAVSQAMIPAIVRTQVLSIGGSLLGILLVTAGDYPAAATLTLAIPYYFATLAGETVALARILRPTFVVQEQGRRKLESNP